MKEQNKVISLVQTKWLPFGKLLIAGTILFFILKRFMNLMRDLQGELVAFHAFWFLISFAILLGYRTLLVYPWRTLYFFATRARSYSTPTFQSHVSFLAGWTLFQLAQLGKYLPGKVGHFLGMVSLCHPLRILKTEAVVSTMQGLALQCFLGFGLGVVLLFSSTKNIFDSWITSLRINWPLLIVLTLVVIGLGCVFLLLLRKGMLLKKMESLKKGGLAMFSGVGSLRVLVIYLLLWAYFGIAFFFFVKSITPIHAAQLPMLIGIYPFAWSIGFLSLITPGGLGVREGILSMLLELCLPPATATLVALLSRVWVMIAEILLAGVAWGFYRRQKRMNANSQDAAIS